MGARFRACTPAFWPDTVNKVYTRHYVGNAGPVGTNPATGQPCGINLTNQQQGGLATDGMLPFIPTVVNTAAAPPPTGPATR